MSDFKHSAPFQPTDRTTIRRLPKRASYERETIYGILDEAFICHVGFVVDGKPRVIPTAYGRAGDTLYIHGSAASHLLRTLSAGVEVCLTVTLVDGLVMARSAFHHSINYRSVVLFGTAVVVDDPGEKMAALKAFSDHVVPGRWDEVREPNELEMKATLVLALPIAEVSAKIRTGPPIDDEADYDLPVWAGVVPITTVSGTPIPDPRLMAGIEPSVRIQSYCRTGTRVLDAE